MKALEKLIEAKDKYQVGDLVAVEAEGAEPTVGQIVKALKTKATVRLMTSPSAPRRPIWSDRLEEIDWEAVTGALPGPEALETAGFPVPDDFEATIERLKERMPSVRPSEPRTCRTRAAGWYRSFAIADRRRWKLPSEQRSGRGRARLT